MSERTVPRARPLARKLGLAALVSLAASCSRTPAAGTARTHQSWSLTNVDTNGWFVARVAVGDEHAPHTLEIRIAPDVHMQSRWSTGLVAVLGSDEDLEPDSGEGLFIEGRELTLDGGELEIGEQGYGSIARAKTVEIQAGEVRVDGERRGSLP